MRRITWLGLCSVLALGTAVYSLRGSGSSDDAKREVRTFRAFPLYWVGSEFEHLPLTQFAHIEVPANVAQRAAGLDAGTNIAVLIYGSCDAEPDSGCAAPLAIQISPACNRNFSLYRFGPPGAPPPQPPVRVEGVPAVWPAGHLELYTDRITIDIYAPGRRALALRAAAALVPANQLGRTRARPGVHLRQPAPGHLQGRLPCP